MVKEVLLTITAASFLGTSIEMNVDDAFLNRIDLSSLETCEDRMDYESGDYLRIFDNTDIEEDETPLQEELKTYLTDFVDVSDNVYTYDEMVEDIRSLQETYEIQSVSLTKTFEDRDVFALKLGNENADKKILLIASIHGREWINSQLVMKSLENFLSDSKEGQDNSLLKENYMVIVPMLNPDGVSIAQKKDVTWKANGRGVDLNRNFETGFGVQRPNTASKAGPFSYPGEEAFSENETKAIRDLAESISFDIAVSYHSCEGAIYYNLKQMPKESNDKNEALAKYLQEMTKTKKHPKGYILGEESNIGGLDYNFLVEKGITSVCIETGRVSCPIPYSEWKNIWNENKDVIRKLLQYKVD